jgi:hypothetical protein
MKGTQANAVPITCKLSNLCVFTTDPDAEYPETILNQNEPFSLRVTVEFSGTGALALIPLCLSIQVNFFAEPCGFGSKVELGHTSVDTSAKLFTYTPTLTVPHQQRLGWFLKPFTKLQACCVGARNSPALITGFIEGFIIQTYA